MLVEAERQVVPVRKQTHSNSAHILEYPTISLSGHDGPINECKFSPNGRILATCASELIFWTVNKQMTCIGALKPHKLPITSISFSPDSSAIATASADQVIALTDTATGKLIRKFKDHCDVINTVEFMEAPHHDLIASGADDGSVIIHDIRQKAPIHKLKSKSPVTSIACSRSFVAVGGVCGGIFVNQLFDNSLKLHYKMNRPGIIYGIAIDPSERFLGAVDSEAVVSIFDLQPLASKRDLAVVPNGEAETEVVPPRIAFSPDGRHMMAGSTDRLLRIWDIENPLEPLEKAVLPGHEGSVTGVDFHPTERLIVSGSTDGIVLVEELDD